METLPRPLACTWANLGHPGLHTARCSSLSLHSLWVHTLLLSCWLRRLRDVTHIAPEGVGTR